MHKQWIWNSFCFAFGHRKVKMHNLWEYSSTRKSLLSKEIYLLISACEEQSSVSNKKAARELSGKCFPTHKLSSNSNYTQYKELTVVKTTPYVTAVGCSLAQLTHAGLQIWVEFTLQWKLASYTMFLRKLSPFLTFFTLSSWTFSGEAVCGVHRRQRAVHQVAAGERHGWDHLFCCWRKLQSGCEQDFMVLLLHEPLLFRITICYLSLHFRLTWLKKWRAGQQKTSYLTTSWRSSPCGETPPSPSNIILMLCLTFHTGLASAKEYLRCVSNCSYQILN